MGTGEGEWHERERKAREISEGNGRERWARELGERDGRGRHANEAGSRQARGTGERDRTEREHLREGALERGRARCKERGMQVEDLFIRPMHMEARGDGWC